MTKTCNEEAAAAYLGCSRGLLKRMRAERRGPRWSRVGRRLVRYPRRWLDEYLVRNSVPPEAEA